MALINIDEVVFRLASKLSNGLDDELVGLRPGCLDCTSIAAPLDMYTGGTRLNATPATASENIKPAMVVNHLSRNIRIAPERVTLNAFPVFDEVLARLKRPHEDNIVWSHIVSIILVPE